MPVLQVLAGEEEGHGGLPSLTKQEGEKRDDEVRKEDYVDEEGMEGKRRDEEEMQFSMLVDEGKMVNFLLDRLPLVSVPFKVFFFPPRTSSTTISLGCTLLRNFLQEEPLCPSQFFCTSH